MSGCAASARSSPASKGCRRTFGCAASWAGISSTRASSGFENNGDPQVFIGSADMMHRNLDRRVEALIRLVRTEHLAELEQLFDLAMADDTSSWWLGSDGEWTRHDRDERGEPLLDLQNDLMRQIGARKRTGSMTAPMTDPVLAAGAVAGRSRARGSCASWSCIALSTKTSRCRKANSIRVRLCPRRPCGRSPKRRG